MGIGQCFWLLCGLPPFLRVRELRAKDRGELRLGSSFSFALIVDMTGCSLVVEAKSM